MTTLFQPRLFHIVAAVGLMVAGGCQGGLKPAMPDVNLPNVFARASERNVPAAEPKVPAPQITERNYAQVQLAMGDSMAKEGNFEAAQSAYEAALRNDDTLARAHHRLALMNEKTGKGGDANEHFLRAMKLDPKNAEIVCDYGYYCYLRQDWKEAQKHFERALQLDPNLKRAHNNLGLVYARTNRSDDALRQFTMAGLNPADARANLGFVYLTQKRFPNAKAELQLAATANPSSAKARDILARFEKIETSAQPEQAQSVAASAPSAEPSIHDQFDVTPLPAAETPRVANNTPRPVAETVRPVAETSRPAAETPRPAAEIQRLAAETPRLAKADTQRPVTLASKPAVEVPGQRPASDRNLPTQQLAPVLSDYQF